MEMRIAVLLLLISAAGGEDASDCTSLCIGGNATVPTSFLGEEVELEENTVTCGALELAMSFGNFDEEECIVAQAMGVAYCGCPDNRDVSGVCHLCEDHSLPDFTLDFDSEQSCLDIYTDMFLDSENLDQCKNIQAVQGSYCGCRNIQASLGMCRICGDRGLMPNTTVMATFSDSCGRLEFMANKVGGADCEQMQQMFGDVCCDYPPEPNCSSICPDGIIENPDARLNVMGGITCAELEEQASLGESTEHQCTEFDFLAAQYCGCSAPRTGAITCPLCEDGSQPPDFDLESLHGKTCLGWATANATITDSAQCSAFQAVQGAYCGCGNEAATKGACRICGEAALLPELNRKSLLETRADGRTPVCGEIEASANQDRENCANYQGEETTSWCCGSLAPTMSPTETGTEPFCDICSFPNMTYLNRDTTMNTPFGEFTCKELDKLGRRNHIESTDCLWVQIGAPQPENCHCVPKSTDSPSVAPSESPSSQPTRNPAVASDSARVQLPALVLMAVPLLLMMMDMILQ